MTLVLFGCAEPGPDFRDDVAVDPAPPRPPDIPWLAEGAPPVEPPRLVCPEGWRERDDGGVQTCDPYPEGGPATCPAGEAHFPGEPACSPIGRACGDGPFPDVADLAGQDLVFALAGADPAGDGSSGAPFGTIAAALEAAPEGATVVLGAGTYDVDRDWPLTVSLRGRCARDTVLTAIDRGGAVLEFLERRERSVTLSGFRIERPDPRGLAIAISQAGPPVLLEGVEVVDQDQGRAISVAERGELRARSLVVRRTSNDSRTAVALGVSSFSALWLERAIIEDTGGTGLWVSVGSQAEVSDLVVRRSIDVVEEVGGVGVRLGLDVRFTLSRVLVEDSQASGVFADGASGEISDVAVRRTGRIRRFRGGGGLIARSGAVTATRVGVVGSEQTGLQLEGDGVALTDSVIVDTTPAVEEPDGGFGVVVGGDGAAVRRVRIARAHGVGLAVGSGVTTEDVHISETELAADGTGGVGLRLTEDANVLRALIEDSVEGGIRANDGGEIALRDVAVRRTVGGGLDRFSGGGIVLGPTDRVTTDRVLVEGTHAVGVQISALDAEVRDIVVRDTTPHPTGARDGIGLSVEPARGLQLERASVDGSHLVGISIRPPSMRMAVRDLEITDTRTDPVASGGTGLLVEPRFGVADAPRVLDRIRVRGTDGPAIVVSGALGREATVLRDVDVAETRGIAIVALRTTRLDRAVFTGTTGCGVWLAGSAGLTMSESRMTDGSVALCLEDGADARARVSFAGELDMERRFQAGPETPTPDLSARNWVISRDPLVDR